MNMAIFRKITFGLFIYLFLNSTCFAMVTFHPALAGYLNLVLEHNPTIQAQRYTLAISSASVQEQLGPFESQLKFNTTKSQDSTGTISSWANKASVSQKLSVGGTVALTIQNTQLTSTSSYASSLGLDFSQPLLKNLGDSINQYSLMSSKIDQEKAWITFTNTVYQIYSQAIDLYGQYFLAMKQKDVALQKVELARYLLEENRRKEQLHLVDSIEVLSAQIEYQSAQSDLTSALYNIQSLENDLRLMLGVDQIPTLDVSEAVFQIEYKAESVWTDGTLEHNSKIKLAKYDLQKSKMALDYSQNQGLPDVSFFANATFSQTDSGLINSFSFSSPAYYLGFSMGIPVGNIDARSKIDEQTLSYQQAELSFKTTQKDIQNQIHKALLDIALKERKISDDKKLLALSAQKLDLEKKKFDLGVNTTDKVITAKQAVSNAEISYYQAVIDYIKAVITLENLKGAF